LVLLEAMALGVPVVSTAYMGTIDIVKPERGARRAPDDETAFAKLVIELLDDRQRREAMSHEATAFAQTWSAAAMAHKLATFYADTIRRTRPDARLQPVQTEA
jgi:1,2-diacylglycerol 3-alpha-glucosyltransferase